MKSAVEEMKDDVRGFEEFKELITDKVDTVKQLVNQNAFDIGEQADEINQLQSKQEER